MLSDVGLKSYSYSCKNMVHTESESFPHDFERTKTKDDTQTNRRGDQSRETQYFVLTCHYLYQLSNEISSLVRLTNQINVMAWASQFQPDRLPDCEFRLFFLALNYWMSLLFTLLLLWKEDQMEETSMLCVAQKTDQISRMRDGSYRTCSMSVHRVNSSLGIRDLFLYFCS